MPGQRARKYANERPKGLSIQREITLFMVYLQSISLTILLDTTLKLTILPSPLPPHPLSSLPSPLLTLLVPVHMSLELITTSFLELGPTSFLGEYRAYPYLVCFYPVGKWF